MKIDLTEVPDVQSFISIPEGVYVCRIAEVRAGTTRDGDPRCCYVIQEDDKVTFHRVDYDFGVTAEKIYQTPDLDNFLGDRIKEGR